MRAAAGQDGMTAGAESSERTPRRGRLPSLSAQVLIALGLGVATGVFLGDIAAPLRIFGDLFIGLLQMTVLPYIVVSLVFGLGRLSYADARVLALRGGLFIALFWILALVMVLAMALVLPNWKSAAFFSTSLVEGAADFDLVDQYIPANPFYSLAYSVVPAVVLFSVALGLALIGVERRDALLASLETLADALMAIAQFVARLAPIGVFALVANAAGTLGVEDFGRLQVYVIPYVVLALFLCLWVLPGLVAALTPLRYRRILGATQDALITAFATGSLLIVLPLIAERVKGLLAELEAQSPDAESAVDLVVPINFNLPNMGKLLSLAFVPFAGWFTGLSVEPEQYPVFLASGLISFFGEVVVALPFLLDLLRIPADMFHLFVAVDILTGRFGTLLAGVHTVVLALLIAAAVGQPGMLRWPRALRYGLLTAAAGLALVIGLRLAFEYVIPHEYRQYRRFVEMELAVEPAPARVLESPPPPVTRDGADSQLERIVRRGSLRVGFSRDRLPFVFRNAAGQLVGFDVDIVHALARDLGVALEFVPLPLESLAAALQAGQCDLAIGGVATTPDLVLSVAFSEPYTTATLAFVVQDHRRREFRNRAAAQELEAPRIGIFGQRYFVGWLQRFLPNAEIVPLSSLRDFFTAEAGALDALATSAETGSAWTLVYPEYSVVVPLPDVVKLPVAFALPREADEWVDYVDTWLRLKRGDTTLEQLHRYWILGEGAESKRSRWSVIRDVLHWVE
jgi:Na+/H+-dicarboxylate symporter